MMRLLTKTITQNTLLRQAEGTDFRGGKAEVKELGRSQVVSVVLNGILILPVATPVLSGPSSQLHSLEAISPHSQRNCPAAASWPAHQRTAAARSAAHRGSASSRR